VAAVGLVAGSFLVVDLSFWAANIIKVPDGGWFPLVVAALVFTLLTTWSKGRRILNERLREGTVSDELFLESVTKSSPVRVRGTAGFMDRTLGGAPPSLLHNLKHNKVLHDRVVFLTVVTEETPHVSDQKRVDLRDLGQGFYRLIVRYGFMQDPDLPNVLESVTAPGLQFPPGDTTYFLGKETLLATKRPGMAVWREKLFGVMSRNARSATSFFRLPPNRVVELGAQIEM
jgi:KUP system potassium uptake protein